MKSRIRSAMLGFGILVVLGAAAASAKPAGTTLLVIPSRYSVVQFGFDIARLRSVYLVAYDRPARPAEPALYAWNNERANWVSIPFPALTDGSLFRVAPVRTVLVGDGAMIPEVLEAALAGQPVHRIASLQAADLANGLHATLRFTNTEWKWLAARYDLQLEDRNVDRRRWGRYGPPGQGGSAFRSPTTGGAESLPEAERVVMPPVTLPEMDRQTLVIPVTREGVEHSPSVEAPEGFTSVVAVPVEKGVPVAESVSVPEAPAVAEAPAVFVPVPAADAAAPAVMRPEDK